jgi:hypothetical protein
MLSVKIDETRGIAELEPSGPLSQQDFEAAAATIDPYLEKVGHLNGLVIHTPDFPSWESFAALTTHLKFIKDHHKKVKRVAFSTDSTVAAFAEAFAIHFVDAEIKLYNYDSLEQARQWAAGEIE